MAAARSVPARTFVAIRSTFAPISASCSCSSSSPGNLSGVIHPAPISLRAVCSKDQLGGTTRIALSSISL